MSTLVYYFSNGNCETFEQYTINSRGVVVHVKTGAVLSFHDTRGYNMITVFGNDGKQHALIVGHAIASTFIGNPTTEHTVEHLDQNTKNDRLHNIRWSRI